MSTLSRLNTSDLPGFAVARVSHLYVIGETGREVPIKVGRAANALWRLSDLQSGNPRRLELRAVWSAERGVVARVEVVTHARLADREVLGEWFDATAAEAIAIIESIGVNHA